MTNDDLLNFVEAAAVLGVSVEKVRRLVVEDRSITATRVDVNGVRHLADLDGLHEGNFQIDDQGVLLIGTPVFEQHRTAGVLPMMVGMTYKAFNEWGGLRIERAELERFQKSVASSTEVTVEPGSMSLSLTTCAGDARLPLGLNPATMASVFEGNWGGRQQWASRFKRPGKWLKTPPVVIRKGLRGRAANGEHLPSLFNPVEFAKVLLTVKGCDMYRLHLLFTKHIDLAAWRGEWDSYRKQVKDLSGH